MCHICHHNPCCCYQAVVSQCPPVYNPCIPVPCPPPSPPFPFNGIYTQFARVAITPQDFFQMPSVHKTIVASPGTGRMIVPILTWAILDFNTVPYDDGLGNVPAMIFHIGANTPFTDDVIMGLTTDSTRFYTLSRNVFVPAIGITCIQDFASTFDNQPLTVSTNITSVNGDSTIYVYCLYSVVTI